MEAAMGAPHDDRPVSNKGPCGLVRVHHSIYQMLYVTLCAAMLECATDFYATKEASVFYDTSAFREKLVGTRDDHVSGIVVLLPAESKRLIARAVVQLPEVKRALKEGLFVVSRGTTCAYIAEELTGTPLPKQYCTAGIVTDKRLAVTVREESYGPWVFRRGALSNEPGDEALKQFTARDVSVKGASAIDPKGHVGVLASNEFGGTIGAIWPVLAARGSHLIVPSGLEKMIASVEEASFKCGNKLWKYIMGAPVALMPVMNALVVTEIEALAVLTGVNATHVASGGVGGSEGAVVLALEGSDPIVKRAFDLVKGLKGEPAIEMPHLQPAVMS